MRKHILALSAVACDRLQFRASAHPVGSFYIIGDSDGISYDIKKPFEKYLLLPKRLFLKKDLIIYFFQLLPAS